MCHIVTWVVAILLLGFLLLHTHGDLSDRYAADSVLVACRRLPDTQTDTQQEPGAEGIRTDDIPS